MDNGCESKTRLDFRSIKACMSGFPMAVCGGGSVRILSGAENNVEHRHRTTMAALTELRIIRRVIEIPPLNDSKVDDLPGKK